MPAALPALNKKERRGFKFQTENPERSEARGSVSRREQSTQPRPPLAAAPASRRTARLSPPRPGLRPARRKAPKMEKKASHDRMIRFELFATAEATGLRTVEPAGGFGNVSQLHFLKVSAHGSSRLGVDRFSVLACVNRVSTLPCPAFSSSA